jgi:hypothetical protein
METGSSRLSNGLGATGIAGGASWSFRLSCEVTPKVSHCTMFRSTTQQDGISDGIHTVSSPPSGSSAQCVVLFHAPLAYCTAVC